MKTILILVAIIVLFGWVGLEYIGDGLIWLGNLFKSIGGLFG